MITLCIGAYRKLVIDLDFLMTHYVYYPPFKRW